MTVGLWGKWRKSQLPSPKAEQLMDNLEDAVKLLAGEQMIDDLS